jgi:hypothetical protein
MGKIYATFPRVLQIVLLYTILRNHSAAFWPLEISNLKTSNLKLEVRNPKAQVPQKLRESRRF